MGNTRDKELSDDLMSPAPDAGDWLGFRAEIYEGQKRYYPCEVLEVEPHRLLIRDRFGRDGWVPEAEYPLYVRVPPRPTPGELLVTGCSLIALAGIADCSRPWNGRVFVGLYPRLSGTELTLYDGVLGGNGVRKYRGRRWIVERWRRDLELDETPNTLADHYLDLLTATQKLANDAAEAHKGTCGLLNAEIQDLRVADTALRAKLSAAEDEIILLGGRGQQRS